MTMDDIAFELAVDRGKCLMRERALIDAASIVADSASIARAEERARFDASLAQCYQDLEKKDAKIKRLKPWANIGKGVVVVGIATLGIVTYNELAP